MRFRTLEIRWHDSKPISTCDFQPVSFKKARPSVGQEEKYAGQAYRLATGGEDNHVRVWMVHPNIRPVGLVDNESASRPPRVEYMATLSRHSAAVNAVRFSPNGEFIASAGDDGMCIIWAPSASPQASTYGSDLSPEDMQHEKEYWKPRTSFRVTPMQVYDLAWSPTGEYIITGSTDNTTRVYTSADGKCVYESAEHSHYVQGVAWDPLNEYIATQSSDRSMHISRISTKQAFEAHAVGKNTRMPHRHSRTPSAHGTSRPRMFRRESTASDAESLSDYPSTSNKDKEEALGSYGKEVSATPLTPATSVASTPSVTMFPPPTIDKPSSRRSSFSGSNAPGSPSTFSRYGRSPSPMPPLPAIRSLPAPSSWAMVKLYGDDSFTNFFRRLTFSPDGGLLLTPAGQFEDPAVIPGVSRTTPKDDLSTPPARGRKGRPSISTDVPALSTNTNSTSSVYIYSRANFARPPIAQLPGHKKASVGVRFSPILYELRQGVEPIEHETKTAVLEKTEGALEVNVNAVTEATGTGAGSFVPLQRTPTHTHSHSQFISQGSIAQPLPRHAFGMPQSDSMVLASPILSPTDLRPPTPAASKPSTPTPNQQSHSHQQMTYQRQTTPSVGTSQGTPATPGSIFALQYRMLYAVLTMDTVAIYDTQQAGPICLLTKLHYDEFTDVTWSPDGQCLILSSRDGYCTLIIFDEILPAYHTQQHTLQLQSIAHNNAVPISYSASSSSMAAAHSTNATPAATPLSGNVALPNIATPIIPKKRSEPPLTPAASVDGGDQYFSAGSFATMDTVAHVPTQDGAEKEDKNVEPPKKKRRVALTRVGDLGS